MLIISKIYMHFFKKLLECAKKNVTYFSKGFFLIKLMSHSILHYSLVSGSIKKLFSIDCVNTYFSQSIVDYLFSRFFQ